ncbi:MAG: DUF1858 domain-containing protein [Ardenticatenaceae bacterium]|nr:DUF1858 domain-containing protein [Ardenticatenaceae bacterium]
MSLQINGSTKLSKVLKSHPEVLDYIVSLNPHDFERLYNPLMRQLMPPRISLERIAAMTNTPLITLLTRIYEIAGQPLTAAERAELAQTAVTNVPPRNPNHPPDWLQEPATAVVDLLESDERLDTDPFVPLFPIINRAQPGDVILLKHRWEPQPLYDVWQKLKIKHYAVQKSQDEWWIYLLKTRASKRGG